jgi:hypothetical protein
MPTSTDEGLKAFNDLLGQEVLVPLFADTGRCKDLSEKLWAKL